MIDWERGLGQFLWELNEGFTEIASLLMIKTWKLASHSLLIHSVSLSGLSSDWLENIFLPFQAEILTNPSGMKHVFVWEDVWRTKTDIVKSRLRALLGKTHRIPARLTQVRRIDQPTLTAFLEANHLQVPTFGKFKYGLFLPNRYYRVLAAQDKIRTDEELLVAVASFSGAKKITRNHEVYRSFELIRFANLLNYTVVGGVDKLLKAFIKEMNPDDIMTYADRDWSNGESYERLGFLFQNATPPQDFWVDSLTFERHYDKKENDIKVYNSGNLKYLLDVKKNRK